MLTNKIFFSCLLVASFNLNCSDSKDVVTSPKGLFAKLTGCINTCPTRTRAVGRSCSAAFNACCEFCQRNPEFTPLTATGLIVVTLATPPVFTLGLAAGLAAGVPIYHKYFAPKED